MSPSGRQLISLLLLSLLSAAAAAAPSFSPTTASSAINQFNLKDPIPTVSLETVDPTLPPVVLQGQTPRCSVVALRHDFAGTVGSPPAASANFTQPPECPFPWTRVVLELSVSASDVLLSGRVAAVWIAGAELLRTATPRPVAPGAFWRVQKDVTRYAALLRHLAAPGGDNAGPTVSMALDNSDNSINSDLPGVFFSANVTLHFYRGGATVSATAVSSNVDVRGLYRAPADLILPVSDPDDGSRSGTGFWRRLDNDTHVATAAVSIPRNTYRAVLELFVSYHGDDEAWYSNPLRSAYLDRPSSNEQGMIRSPSTARANGGFRQVYATIDGRFAGGHIPFPVLYSSSVNPYFWSPVAAIAAFDMPSYDLDLTPFLGELLDGRPHSIGLAVREARPYWLVSANLHLWVDAWSDATQAGLIEYFAPEVKMNRNAEWRGQDGQSEVDAEGLFRATGWVSSSRGNLTTQVRQKIKFKSQVEVQNRGSTTQVEVQNKERMTLAIQKGNQVLGRVQLLMEAPLQVQTTRVSAAGGAVFEKSRLYHQLMEQATLSEGQAMTVSTLTDRQDAEGSALMHGDSPVWGSATTRSAYRYKDDTTCYLRTLNSAGGVIMADIKSASCAAVADA